MSIDAVPEVFWQVLSGLVPHGAAITPLALGCDCDAFVIDGRIVVKRPKHVAAEERLRREAALLALVRPRVTLAVPDLHLVEGRLIWSWHEMLPGRQLLAADFSALSKTAQARLAHDLAFFLADLHGLAVPFAGRVQEWSGAARLVDLVAGLPGDLQGASSAVAEDYAALPPAPLGEVFGQFDTHGWNMAFDPEAERLNGIYDFGDAGIGPRHRDFIYCSLTSLDLMARVVGEYRTLTGLDVGMGRVRVLAGAHRLWEWGEGKAADREWLARNLAAWAEWRRASPLEGGGAELSIRPTCGAESWDQPMR